MKSFGGWNLKRRNFTLFSTKRPKILKIVWRTVGWWLFVDALSLVPSQSSFIHLGLIRKHAPNIECTRRKVAECAGKAVGISVPSIFVYILAKWCPYNVVTLLPPCESHIAGNYIKINYTNFTLSSTCLFLFGSLL